MRKILMIGVTLFATLSCDPPTVKKPVEMFIVNRDFLKAETGFKNLNIKSKSPETVGEWITETELISLEQFPKNMMCFSLKDWLKKVKPKLKEGNEYYLDYK